MDGLHSYWQHPAYLCELRCCVVTWGSAAGQPVCLWNSKQFFSVKMEKINRATTKYGSVLFWPTHNSILATLCQFYQSRTTKKTDMNKTCIFLWAQRRLHELRIGKFALHLAYFTVKIGSYDPLCFKRQTGKGRVCGSNITFEVCVLSSAVCAVGQSLDWMPLAQNPAQFVAYFLVFSTFPFSRPEFASLVSLLDCEELESKLTSPSLLPPQSGVEYWWQAYLSDLKWSSMKCSSLWYLTGMLSTDGYWCPDDWLGQVFLNSGFFFHFVSYASLKRCYQGFWKWSPATRS